MTEVVEELRRVLEGGGHSLVVQVDGQTVALDGFGVSDLLRLTADGQALLAGSVVADKVIGKAAASLMVLGGVREAWGGIVSDPAVAMLESHGVKVSWGLRVANIENRRRDGLCPLETACRDCETAEACREAIVACVAAMREKKERLKV